MIDFFKRLFGFGPKYEAKIEWHNPSVSQILLENQEPQVTLHPRDEEVNKALGKLKGEIDCLAAEHGPVHSNLTVSWSDADKVELCKKYDTYNYRRWISFDRRLRQHSHVRRLYREMVEEDWPRIIAKMNEKVWFPKLGREPHGCINSLTITNVPYGVRRLNDEFAHFHRDDNEQNFRYVVDVVRKYNNRLRQQFIKSQEPNAQMILAPWIMEHPNLVFKKIGHGWVCLDFGFLDPADRSKLSDSLHQLNLALFYERQHHATPGAAGVLPDIPGLGEQRGA